MASVKIKLKEFREFMNDDSVWKDSDGEFGYMEGYSLKFEGRTYSYDERSFDESESHLNENGIVEFHGGVMEFETYIVDMAKEIRRWLKKRRLNETHVEGSFRVPKELLPALKEFLRLNGGTVL